MMRAPATIHLVMGISSVGKSSFIASRIAEGQWENLPIHMASELDGGSDDPRLAGSCVVHYNLLRPFGNQVERLGEELTSDPVLRVLLAHPERVRCVFLMTGRGALLKRVLTRTAIEPHLRGTGDPYPGGAIFELLCALDLVEFHRRWLGLLREHGISVEIRFADGGRFRSVDTETEALALIGATGPASYGPEEIDGILQAHQFEYQQIELAAGRSTPGQDRSMSLRFLAPDLAGRSLLDIGCGYGYFCFEAERRHAARVVGTELKRHRYLGCLILKEILGMGATFMRRDLFAEPLDEVFDVVLLLNVLHHLKEPVKALRMAARACRETLIIEFPTLLDNKFRATLPVHALLPDPALPIIGVSELGAQDQTFLFSPAAIERILLEHERLFSRIDFEPSPMSEERMVAICLK